MRHRKSFVRLALCLVTACGSAKPQPTTPWQVPDGWKHERIELPLDFAPSLPHKGVEELRFAPGFFDPSAPGYWSYAFVWRLDDNAMFDATTVGAELTTYFRGLVDAVDEKHEIVERDSIVVHAAPANNGLALTAHVIDPFTTKKSVELVGTARQVACAKGALWVFSIAPAQSPVRAELDALTARATCEQPTLPNVPKKAVYGTGTRHLSNIASSD